MYEKAKAGKNGRRSAVIEAVGVDQKNGCPCKHQTSMIYKNKKRRADLSFQISANNPHSERIGQQVPDSSMNISICQKAIQLNSFKDCFIREPQRIDDTASSP